MASLTERVVAASRGRDRVLDSVKAFALAAVVVGHSLAWHITPAGTAVNVLEITPALVILTWVFQVLPLFFAAGAVSNAISLQRRSRREFWRHRARSLGTPVLLYVTVWSAVMLPLTLVSSEVVPAGKFVAQLLWFAGVYLIIVAAAPWTVQWRSRPVVALSLWLLLIISVDLTRILGGPGWIGWLNMLLVWGWLHQLGYQLPWLRSQRRGLVAIGALALIASAAALALAGPYSSSLVTVSSDDSLSNLAPPSVVLALYGAGLVCGLAAAWPMFSKWLAHDRVWLPFALVGARGMGIYLWHIPLVGLAAGVALIVGWSVPALSGQWWLVHLGVLLLVLPGAWFIAGLAARGERRLQRVPTVFGLPPTLVAFGVGFTILNISVTGTATWLGAGLLGLPSSAVVNLVLLVLLWQASAGSRGAASLDPG